MLMVKIKGVCEQLCCSQNDSKEDAGMMPPPSIIAMMLAAIAAAEQEEMPNASPLDLLTRSEYQEIDARLENDYGPFRKFIDENYLALLIKLSEYEDIDIDAKLTKHIAREMIHNKG